MKQVHAEWIKKWADGEHVQWRNANTYPWTTVPISQDWSNFATYTCFRVRPTNIEQLCHVAMHGNGKVTIGNAELSESNLRLTFLENKLIKAEVVY